MSLFSSNDEQICTPFALHNRTNTIRGQIEKSRLEPEDDFGNIEYKLKLVDPTPGRIEKLVTQLKWRIREGLGEAIVFLGVKDDGIFVGLTPEEAKLSLQTLECMSAKIGAKMIIVNERIVDTQHIEDTPPIEELRNSKGKIIRNRVSYGVKYQKEDQSAREEDDQLQEDGSRKFNANKHQRKQPTRKVFQILVKCKTLDVLEELRVAVLGPTDVGKSSLSGVLSHGDLDNGSGSARVNLFRHRHEIRSGHTSSISQEVFGFTSQGRPLTYNICLSAEEMIELSSRIVTLIDLAGHQRYMSTTLFGLGCHSPDIVLLVVNATLPVNNLTTDLISLALAMEKSLVIVINKIDLAPERHKETVYHEIVEALRFLHPEIILTKVDSIEEAVLAGSMLNKSRRIPTFFTSCVTGSGTSYLYEFFKAVAPKASQTTMDLANTQGPEVQIDETFEVPGIGTVVSGFVIEGIIREGDELLLGPDVKGDFRQVTIVSLQRHRTPCNLARAGQQCTMAIVGEDLKVRRGMIMKEFDQDWRLNFTVCTQFEAEIKLISNKKGILRKGSQVFVYAGNVRQPCKVRSVSQISDDTLRVGLKFTKGLEYMRKGSRLIMRHALVKGIGLGVGIVSQVEKFQYAV